MSVNRREKNKYIKYKKLSRLQSLALRNYFDGKLPSMVNCSRK